MSQDVRNQIIAENVPKLIKSILCTENEDETFRVCENLAWNQIKFNRYISTNSHSVRRRIDELIERFNVENMHEFSKFINLLCNKLIEHPLCINHYEIDIQWSVIDFLISLAYQPIAIIRCERTTKDAHRVSALDQINKFSTNITDTNKEPEICLDELKECFLPKIDYSQEDEGNDISDWSDHDLKNEQLTPVLEHSFESSPTKYKSFPKGPKGYALSNFKPPVFPTQFTVYQNTNQLEQKVHTCWWRTNNHQYAAIQSTSILANFAIAYAQYLNKMSNNLITFNLPSTLPESCLLREIIMIFFAPVDCKFFKLVNNELDLCADVTIPSVTVTSIQSYLHGKVLKPIRLMHEIHKMLQIYESSLLPPRTLTSFTASIRLLLKPIKERLISFERRLLEQNENEINTLMTFEKWMRDSFKQLEFLHSIVKLTNSLCLEAPSHLKSMFLLSQLYNLMKSAENDTTIAAVFLVTFKVYCSILDMWWHKGCLQDWQNEFVVKHTLDSKSMIVLRELKYSEITHDTIEFIQKCPLYKLLCKHALETGITQNILAEMDLTSEMLENCRTARQQALHDELLNDILDTLHQYSDGNDGDGDQKDVVSSQAPSSINSSEPDNNYSNVLSCLNATQDEHLLGAFSINLITDFPKTITHQSLTVQDLLERLNQQRSRPPLYHIFYEALNRILTKRVDNANQFVMRLYLKDLSIGTHIQHIRNVMLLQANSIMYFFYDKLFQNIESNKSWANAASLSMQLDGIISAYLIDKPAPIHVELRSKLCARINKVCEVTDEISLTYELNPALSYVITPNNIDNYNKVFRMLLKIKWAVWKLEHLRFPNKRRNVLYGSLSHIELLKRRLEQLRFWLIYVIGSLHFHFCNEVFVMGQHFDNAINNCKNLSQLKQLHQSYLDVICQHCLITDSFHEIRVVLDQFFHLICVVDMEWQSCISIIEDCYALSLDNDQNDSKVADISIEDYLCNNDIDQLEQTYVRCHQLMATLFSNEVAKNGRNYLYGLDGCFSSSVPY